MRFRDYFRDKVKDLCVSIVNSLTSSDEFSENEKKEKLQSSKTKRRGMQTKSSTTITICVRLSLFLKPQIKS